MRQLQAVLLGIATIVSSSAFAGGFSCVVQANRPGETIRQQFNVSYEEAHRELGKFIGIGKMGGAQYAVMVRNFEGTNEYGLQLFRIFREGNQQHHKGVAGRGRQQPCLFAAIIDDNFLAFQEGDGSCVHLRDRGMIHYTHFDGVFHAECVRY